MGFQRQSYIFYFPHSLGPQELLGGLWAYVRMQPPSDHEQLAMLSAAYPTAAALLPGAIAALTAVHLAGGHMPQHGPGTAGKGAAAGGKGGKKAGKKAGVAEPMDASGPGADAHAQQPSFWWHSAAAVALAAAGLRQGELALALNRHFSVRDLFKWGARMAALHGAALGTRSLAPLASTAKAMMALAAGSSDRDGAAALSQQPAAGGVYDLSQADVRLREGAFRECADLFAALVPKPEARTKLLRALAEVRL